jgi:hypothetical protein
MDPRAGAELLNGSLLEIERADARVIAQLSKDGRRHHPDCVVR